MQLVAVLWSELLSDPFSLVIILPWQTVATPHHGDILQKLKYIILHPAHTGVHHMDQDPLRGGSRRRGVTGQNCVYKK